MYVNVEVLIFLCGVVNVASCHCLALDVEGRCYTWGRNEVWLLSCNTCLKLSVCIVCF